MDVSVCLFNSVKYLTFQDETINNEEFFTLQKLLEMIPASVGEIENYLKTLRIIEFDGTFAPHCFYYMVID